MHIVRLRSGDEDVVVSAPELFDHAPTEEWTTRFLLSPGHHLVVAVEGDETVGFVSAVETTHPDKGTEMFLYELGVAPSARKRGVATELVRALAALAETRGCYGMWVAVDVDNVAALATYRRAGAQDETACVVQSWDFTKP